MFPSVLLCHNPVTQRLIRPCALRLERGGRHQILISCACFSIALLCLNVFRHTIHQMKAVYLSYPLIYIKIYFVQIYIV